jgi:ferric-dicitrate binding protein FerR (iron transport regulator)
VFDHTSLLEITFLIKENFGAEVHIADSSLIKRRVSGRFQAQTADELLKVLAEMMHMEITCTKDSTYILHSRQEDFF